MSDIAIRVENLSKQYKIGVKRHNRLSDTLTDRLNALFRRSSRSSLDSQPSVAANSKSEFRNPKSDFIWALKDVSLEVKQGETLGIIGRNGAGKSTLLKILSRITEPTSGRAHIFGRVGSLLEVGTGFHPELTGRENIYLNGAILGMGRAEIARKFDEIVDFSGVEKFIDTPVKRYSSGMYVRLAFAVAAHLEPEILIVDEVLAVGDAAFQKKCLGKMEGVAKEGRTVLFVSHNMAAIENLCRKVLLLDSGCLVLSGDPIDVINRYLSSALALGENTIALVERRDRSGTGKVRLTSFHVEDKAGNILAAARSGMDVVFVFGFECVEADDLRNVDIGFSVHRGTFASDKPLFVLYSSYLRQTFNVVPRRGAFRCYIPKLPLVPGLYSIGARVTVGMEEADWPRNGVGELSVESGDFYGTGSRGHGSSADFLVSGKWSVCEPCILRSEN